MTHFEPWCRTQLRKYLHFYGPNTMSKTNKILTTKLLFLQNYESTLTMLTAFLRSADDIITINSVESCCNNKQSTE